MKWRSYWALSVGLSPLAATRRQEESALARPPEQQSVGARKATVAVATTRETGDRRTLRATVG